MAVISGSSQRPSITPPVQCSSRNSMVDSREGSKRTGKSPTSSADFLDETSASKSKDNHGEEDFFERKRTFDPTEVRWGQ